MKNENKRDGRNNQLCVVQAVSGNEDYESFEAIRTLRASNKEEIALVICPTILQKDRYLKLANHSGLKVVTLEVVRLPAKRYGNIANIKEQLSRQEIDALILVVGVLDRPEYKELLFENSDLVKIGLLIVPEAQFLSFKKVKYENVSEIRKNFPNLQVRAIVSIKNSQIENDLKEIFGTDLEIEMASDVEENLWDNGKLQLVERFLIEDWIAWILAYIEQYQKGKRGIIYCFEELEGKQVKEYLCRNNITCGMLTEKGEPLITIGKTYDYFETNQFEYEFVIHLEMYSNLIAYFDCIGRAVRRNKEVSVILFDKVRENQRASVNDSVSSEEKQRKQKEQEEIETFIQSKRQNKLLVEVEITRNDYLDAKRFCFHNSIFSSRKWWIREDGRTTIHKSLQCEKIVKWNKDEQLEEEFFEIMRDYIVSNEITWITFVPSRKRVGAEVVPDFVQALAERFELRCREVLEINREEEDLLNEDNYADSVLRLANAEELLYLSDECEIEGGNVLLVDDRIRNNRWDFAVCGSLLRANGSGKVFPFVYEETINNIQGENMSKKEEQMETVSHKPYAFEWKPVGGLSELREDLFQLALQMVDRNLITVKSKLTKSGEVRIEGKVEIEGNVTLCEIANKVAAANGEKSVIGISSLNVRLDCSDNIKVLLYGVAGYIKYLRDCGQEDKIEKARIKYKKREYWHNSHCLYEDMPSFSLPIGLFVGISEESLRIAKLLHERNYVSLVRNIVDTEQLPLYITNKDQVYQDSVETQEIDEWYVIHTVTTLMTYSEDLNALEEMILADKIDRTSNSSICLAVDQYGIRDGILDSIVLAGYLNYLDSKDEYGEYKSIRKYLSNIPKDNPLLSEQVEKISEVIRSERESGLYCVVEGGRGAGKKEMSRAIASMLQYYKKIDDKEQYHTTFIDMAISLATDEGGKYGAQQDPLLSESSTMEFGKFKKRTLYILSDLKEFLHGCKDCVPGDGSPASHLIKVLSRYQPQTYIVIVGEKKYIEKFLELSQGIKRAFGEYRIVIPSISVDKIFEIYCRELSKNNQKRLEKNPEFETEFMNYLVKNRNSYPWNNKDLANYLADYSNNKQKLCLPSTSVRSARKMLENVVGMNKIKETMNEFERYIMNLGLAKMNGKEIPPSNRHMFFIGNPGTGKTMVAELIAELLYDIGMIQEKKFKSVERKDLVAGYFGQTAEKVDRVIQEALGGVLFIDEAYSLTPKSERDFGAEAIDTLIVAMEKYKEDLIVIFAGYEKEMQEFRNSNPGISSRITYTFHFEDYTTEELIEIVKRDLEKSELYYVETEKEQIIKQLQEVFQYFKRKKNFGNGRFASRVVSKIIENYFSIERSGEGNDEITLADIPTIKDLLDARNDGVNEEIGNEFTRIIGMKSVKDKIEELETKMNYQMEAKKLGITPHASNKHMLFQGNSGTGKTMVARLITQKLYDIGVIMENKCIEVERVDLVGEHIGATAPKVRAEVERALGGVLFIDEAYSLTPKSERDFGGEAITTLIKAMEDHKEDLVVIFAGYEKEMDEFIASNPGLASRIGYHFLFEDYSDKELLEIFQVKLEQLGYLLEKSAEQTALAVMTYFCRVKDFGNGRFVDNVIEEVELVHGENVMQQLEKVSAKGDEEKAKFIKSIQKNDIPSVERMAKRMNGSKYMIMPERITNRMSEVIATHEIGHAYVQYKLFPDAKIEKITIKVGGDGAFGYMKFDPTTFKAIMTKKERVNWIAIYMAGIAAEEVFFGEYEEGGSSDLKGAKYYAKRMITSLGMSENGLAGGNDEKEIHQEINSILEGAYGIAKGLIESEKERFQSAVALLVKKKELTEKEFMKCVEGK